MTPTQYQTVMAAVAGLSDRVDHVIARLSFQFPLPGELEAQIDAELDAILRESDCGVQPFAQGIEVGVRYARRLAEERNNA